MRSSPFPKTGDKKPGTDGTFTNFHLLKNWETFRLSPIFSGFNRRPD
jgi:hypothetical protein